MTGHLLLLAGACTAAAVAWCVVWRIAGTNRPHVVTIDLDDQW